MDKAVLSTLMKTKLETIFAWPVYDPAELKKFTDAMAEAVVEHIQSTAKIKNGALDATGVTVNPTTGIGSVNNGAVSGDIE